MEQIIKQNMFSRTLFNESKLGAYYTDPVHAAKIGRLFRLQGECCVLEPSFGNAEALKAFLSQCERADEAGSVHTFGVELNRETFECALTLLAGSGHRTGHLHYVLPIRHMA